MIISILFWILFIMVFLLTFLWAIMLVGGISIMIDVRKYRYEKFPYRQLFIFLLHLIIFIFLCYIGFK